MKSKHVLMYGFFVLSSLALLNSIQPVQALSRINLSLLGQSIQETFPEELEVKFYKGELTINQALPYSVYTSLPNTAARFSPFPLIVFTTNEFISSFEVRETLRPLIFLTESHLLLLSKQDYQAFKYPSINKEIIITHDNMVWIEQLLQRHPFFTYELHLLLFWVCIMSIEVIFGSLLYLVWIVLASSIAVVVVEIQFGTSVGLRNGLKIGVFTLSLPMLILSVLGSFRIATLPWSLSFLVYLAWTVFITRLVASKKQISRLQHRLGKEL